MKTINTIGFRRIYAIVSIKSNTKHNFLNLTVCAKLIKCIEVYLPNKWRNRQASQFVSESWREVSCTTMMICGFSNFVGPQPARVNSRIEWTIFTSSKPQRDENAPCFDDSEDVREVVARNVP